MDPENVVVLRLPDHADDFRRNLRGAEHHDGVAAREGPAHGFFDDCIDLGLGVVVFRTQGEIGRQPLSPRVALCRPV